MQRSRAGGPSCWLRCAAGCSGLVCFCCWRWGSTGGLPLGAGHYGWTGHLCVRAPLAMSLPELLAVGSLATGRLAWIVYTYVCCFWVMIRRSRALVGKRLIQWVECKARLGHAASSSCSVVNMTRM
jgi:hypothetical protein